MVTLVLDTNVLVAALRSKGGASRQVLRHCLTGLYQPVVGNALWSEYEDVLGRSELWRSVDITLAERMTVLAALAGRSRWVRVSFGWRPNLPDEADNHLIELAVAAGAHGIVTHNLKDLKGGELHWPTLQVCTPSQCMLAWPQP